MKALMTSIDKQRRQGFTIIEVLIVVVVIAVLATITIFAFGSWRARTATTEVKTALIHLSSSLKNELTFTNSYPSAVPSNYKPSTGVTINYSTTGTGGYCASGTSTAVPSVVWYISSSELLPSKTSCS